MPSDGNTPTLGLVLAGTGAGASAWQMPSGSIGASIRATQTGMPWSVESDYINPQVGQIGVLSWIEGGVNLTRVRSVCQNAGSVTYYLRYVDGYGLRRLLASDHTTDGSLYNVPIDALVGTKRDNRLGTGDLVEVVISGTSGTSASSVFSVNLLGTSEPQAGPVYRIGTKLYCDGAPWMLWGGTTLGALDTPGTIIERCALARHANMNTVRVVGFIDGNPVAFGSQDWSYLDRIVATAGSMGLKVLIDMSTYYGCLINGGFANPFGATALPQWYQEFDGMAAHVNPWTGIPIKDDPTIAIVSIAGEPNPPWYAGAVCTPTELTTFYTNVSAHAKGVMPNRLICTGGFLHLDGPGANYMVQSAGSSGIDWQAIFGAPGIDVGAYHIASWADFPNVENWVGSWSATNGKAFIDEEVDFDQANSQCTGGGYAAGDAGRAAAYNDCIAAEVGAGSAGVIFWNLGYGGGAGYNTTGSFDISPFTPLAYAKVREKAPTRLLIGVD